MPVKINITLRIVIPSFPIDRTTQIICALVEYFTFEDDMHSSPKS